jgi:hypothetical protein
MGFDRMERGPRALLSSRAAGGCARYGLVRLLGYGRDVFLAVWAIGVLAFCVLGLAGAML